MADPSADTLKAIAQLVGLPEDALPSEVAQAVQDLAVEIAMPDVPSTDALDGGGADPAPAKLSKAEQAYCTKHKLSAAAFAAKKKASVHNHGKPIATASVALSSAKPAVACPAPFTREQLAYAARERVPLGELRQHLADRAKTMTRRAK